MSQYFHLQRARYVFTLNNYQQGVNYKEYLSRPEFKITRAIVGYEIGENGIPHLQGYVELQRSMYEKFSAMPSGKGFEEHLFKSMPIALSLGILYSLVIGQEKLPEESTMENAL